MSKKSKLIELGVSNRPHGIKGGFLFKLKNQDSSILKDGFEIFIYPDNEKSSISSDGEKVIIEKIHFGNKTICYLKGVRDRNLVEEMLPFKIFVNRSDFPEPEKDEWYLEDLKGLDVFDIDGYKIGKVKNFFDNGAQTVLQIKLENEVVELPFVEVFFPYVDLEKNKITMILPEYE
jgi:16S rRNA processing protein RimM